MTEIKHDAVSVIEKHQLAERVHPVVAAAMAQNPNPETLRELLAVQREWEAGESRKAYTRALAELKRDLPTVLNKDQTVAFGTTRYTHTSLGAVMDAVTGPLTMHGFSLSWHPATDGSTVTVTCRLTHCAGHCEETSISAPRDDKGSKSPAQGIASTITMLSRYTALSLLGIATADMAEPSGPDPNQVDSQRNMKAVAAFVKAGLSRELAEAHVGKPVGEWTAADLDTLREWFKQQTSKPEPGSNG